MDEKFSKIAVCRDNKTLRAVGLFKLFNNYKKIYKQHRNISVKWKIIGQKIIKKNYRGLQRKQVNMRHFSLIGRSLRPFF